VLELLNDALLRQRSRDEFCTVAYAGLELNGAQRARVTVSCGGHPLPFVLRAAGAVEPLGRYGTLLGFEKNPQLSDESAELAAGDALVLYTDGLTDAYAPVRVLSSADLVPILRRCAGGSAPEIARGIRDAVLNGGALQPRDDIALLVLRLVDSPDRPEAELTRLLPCEAGAPGQAREAIGELEPVLGSGLSATVSLLVSEIVTNSIRHAGTAAGDTVELQATVFADRLRVEVSDHGTGFRPRTRVPDLDSASGWGLYLVDQLADRWGVHRDDATRVWFEMDRGSTEQPAGS
jgi:anti-sigma regulatory factor (Ser/Thr protein kinase)